MSMVTDIVLLCPLEQGKALSKINDYLKSTYNNRLKEISEYCGGNKAFQADLWVGAFNSMDTKEFLECVKDVADDPIWDCCDKIQLMIKEENEEEFRVYEFATLDRFE